jgi:biopolymer transport protein ExbD
MRFYTRKRRATPAVIVVALIDVLIILLIFLLVTTTFKQQPALRLALPESSQALKTGANEAAPLVVWVDDKGSLRLGNEATPVTVEKFKAELASRTQNNPELRLAISADKGAPFGQIVRIMDAAKEAKIKVSYAYTKESGAP